MNLTTYDMDYLNVPTYLRHSKPTLPTCTHKTIDLADSNLQAISVIRQLDGMKSGEVLKVEGELTDTCTMNIREFTGAKVVRCDGVTYVTSAYEVSAEMDCEDYFDTPAIVRMPRKTA